MMRRETTSGLGSRSRERRLDDDFDVVAEGIGDRARLLGFVRVGREWFLRDPGHRARDLQANLRNLEAALDLARSCSWPSCRTEERNGAPKKTCYAGLYCKPNAQNYEETTGVNCEDHLYSGCGIAQRSHVAG